MQQTDHSDADLGLLIFNPVGSFSDGQAQCSRKILGTSCCCLVGERLVKKCQNLIP